MNNKYSEEEIKNIAEKLSNKKYEIIEDLNEVRFYEAIEKYDELLSYMEEHFPDKKEVNIELIGLRIYFLGQKYEKVLTLINSIIDIINKNKTYEDNIKDYFKSFVYNIQVISALFSDNIELANEARKKYLNTDVELEEALIISLAKKYPIYHYMRLEEFFKLDFYTEKYSKEKLDFIIEYSKEMYEMSLNNKS